MYNGDSRRFNGHQRVAMYLAQDGKCAICGVDLTPGWHADHVEPWSKGGETDIINGQALCPTCNLKKGDASVLNQKPLRVWQQKALDHYRDVFKLDMTRSDYLLCACPSAGKTRWALTVSRLWLNEVNGRVVIVVPSAKLVSQWIDSANKEGIQLAAIKNRDGGIENLRDPQFHGCVLTYAQMNASPELQHRGCVAKPTLVFFDEIHHLGEEESWGRSSTQAFGIAQRRIGLSGTPWRPNGKSGIPFVTYKRDIEGKLIVHVDYNYSYGQGVSEKCCRPIQFLAFNGEVKLINLDSCAASSLIMTLGENDTDNSKVLRGILDPDQPWLPSILQEAHNTLIYVRKGDMVTNPVPNAKGLIIAIDIEHAKQIGVLLQRITGETPEVFTSEDEMATDRIKQFEHNTTKWAVAVNMISEGVDIPNLVVGVYATNKSAPMIFTQIVGRFIRRQSDTENCSAWFYMPATEKLKGHAKSIENMIPDPLSVKQKEVEVGIDSPPDSPSAVDNFLISGVSRPELDAIFRSGDGEYTGEEIHHAIQECEAVGLPPQMAATIAALLRRNTNNNANTKDVSNNSSDNPQPLQKHAEELKGLIQKLVARLWRHLKSQGIEVEFPEIWNVLGKRFGYRSGNQQTVQQLEEEYQYLLELGRANWKDWDA